MTPESKNQIFFFLTFFAGLLVLSPLIDYQSVMATGDHGRDLYAAQVSLKGHLPYRDYWWVYGPLMPYYYGLCFKILGVHIPAVLTGKALLALVSSLFVYLALTAALVPAGLAFIGAMWFLLFFPEFFITYNHVGGTVLLSALTYLTIQYFRQPKTIFLYLGLLCAVVLALVKINFGLAALLMLLAAVIGADFFCKNKITREKLIFYAAAALAFPLLVMPVYFFLLKGLPTYALRQCFPYVGAYTLHHTPVMESAGALFQSILRTITANPISFFMAIVVILCGARTARMLLTKKTKENIPVILTIVFLVFFYIINLHEFLASGVTYRLAWSKPFSHLLMFIVLGIGAQGLKKWIRVLLYATLALIGAIQFLNANSSIQAFKDPFHYLGVERAKVFLGNDPAWINTVTRTVAYLKTNLKDDELFFALPYDALYYFLTDKASPTRQIIFFDHEFIPPEQEKATIADLEDRRVNWVLLSSRQNSREFGLGTLGKTYCPLLGAYIAENFETVAQFGDWVNEPGWAWNHGTKILKRKQRGAL
ncbi:MAG: hypothetical protein HZC18_07755 [Candidatus Omnitrophica bacterium]|nr:hypothetical protein [Candidatus Omnitrophota bacterium]